MSEVSLFKPALTTSVDKTTADVRAKKASWDGYFRANQITDNEMKLLTEFEAAKAGSSLKEAMARNGIHYIYTIVKCLGKLSAIDTQCYLLILIEDLLPEYESLFLELPKIEPELPFNIIVKLLTKADDFISLKAGRIFCLLSSARGEISEENANLVSAWIESCLVSSDKDKIDLGTSCLQAMLRIAQFKSGFIRFPTGISNLCAILGNFHHSQQTKYQVIFCLWLLSFEPVVAAQLQQKYEMIPTLVEILRSIEKEKVIRVTIATLKNMLEKARAENVSVMIGIKLLQVLDTLSARNYSDEEIAADLAFLREELSKVYNSLSTFEEYAAEVRSGKLEWTPPHQSDLFWKNYAARLDENDLELLRILTRLLFSSNSTQVLSIASNDIGQYVKFHPQGRKYAQSLGTKQQIMQLMTHPDPDVRYHALTAVQKYMLNAWNM